MKSKPWCSPGQLVVLMLAGWINRHQHTVIAYQKEEIRVLREMLGGKRLRFTDQQRRRLALKAKALFRCTLRELGPLVTPDTLCRCILAEDGIGPAPERRKHMPWATFRKAHWGTIAAMDFFKVEVMTLIGPVRYSVLVVMDLKTRHVEVTGIVREAYEKWMLQILRTLTDAVSGFLLGKTHLIMDRDPVFTAGVRDMLRHAGTKPVRLPRRSPNLNAFTERFIRSIKEECLDRVIPLGEAHLREVIREYMSHYHEERPHQGLDGTLIRPAKDHAAGGPVARRERLGGLLNYYYREAA
jgi:transposase InsO family protein